MSMSGPWNGYLYALDANSGAIRWKVDTITDRRRGYSITGSPYIAKDLVVIGNSGAEYDARAISPPMTQDGSGALALFYGAQQSHRRV